MIKLVQFPPALGLPNASPFCMKLENLLRLLDLEYENSYIDDPRKYPKGKLPAIEHDGTLIADSRIIAAHLLTLAKANPDNMLTPEQQAIAHASTRMLEESFYFIVMHQRWMHEASWPQMRKALFSNLKPPMSWILPSVLRKKIARDLQGQGTGRMTQDEIVALGLADIAALEQLLGEKTFFFGADPCSFDAVAYASLAGICHSTISTPLGALPDSLVSYCDRMKARLYPDGYPTKS